jgi:hypothetical protein
MDGASRQKVVETTVWYGKPASAGLPYQTGISMPVCLRNETRFSGFALSGGE